MKTRTQQTENMQTGHPKAQKQDSMGGILQAYKNKTVQQMELDQEEPVQRKLEATKEEEPLQRKSNDTGLSDNLKSGIENLSGYSMDDVKVHYNSSQPATLQAHAYAQGTDIHVAPGQEKHVPHEAWHVVQQKQGRVKPTKQLKGTVPVNDDAGLEKEADIMGAKALQKKTVSVEQASINSKKTEENILQRVPWSRGAIDGKQTDVDWTTSSLGGSNVGIHMIANPLGPEHLQGGPPRSGVQKNLMNQLETDPHNSNENKYIRGHLLNDNVGGPGADFNLFPITGNANKEHEQKIETRVKDWVNNKKQWVRYEVGVQADDIDLTHSRAWRNHVNATFNCSASILDPNNGMQVIDTVSAAIKSEYGVSYNNQLKTINLGNFALIGNDAQGYSPLLSTTKIEFNLNDEEIEVLQHIDYLLSNKKSANALKKELLSYEGIGKVTIERLENFDSDDSLSDLEKNAKMAVQRILKIGGDELLAICGQVYEDRLGY